MGKLHGVSDSEACFADLVRFIRGERGLTQGGLAEALGISRSVVAFVESKRRPLVANDLPSWGAAMSVDATDLEALRLACQGYWRRPNGEWAFYLDDFDPEAYARGIAEISEHYVDLPHDQMRRIAELVNRLTGRECASVYTEEPAEGPVTMSGIPPRGIALPPGREDEPRVVNIHLPEEPPLGDLNEPVRSPAKQGTIDDLTGLIEQLTDVQVALTAAFARGLLAQAKSRRGPRGGPPEPDQ
jgi:transcriptional regulator with XRE-family HTH domain